MGTGRSQFTLVLIAFAAVGVIILAIGLYFGQRTYNEAQKLDKMTLDAKAKKKQIDDELATWDDRKKELADLEAEQATIDSDLIDYKYIPTYLSQLQSVVENTRDIRLNSIQPEAVTMLNLTSSKLAKDSGIAPAPVKPVEPKPGEAGAEVKAGEAGIGEAAAPKPEEKKPPVNPKNQYRVQKITLNCTGTYSSVLDLLEKLRQFKKLVYLRAVTMNASKSDGRTYLNVRLETYLIITPEQYKAPDPKKKEAAGAKPAATPAAPAAATNGAKPEAAAPVKPVASAPATTGEGKP